MSIGMLHTIYFCVNSVKVLDNNVNKIPICYCISNTTFKLVWSDPFVLTGQTNFLQWQIKSPKSSFLDV